MTDVPKRAVPAPGLSYGLSGTNDPELSSGAGAAPTLGEVLLPFAVALSVCYFGALAWYDRRHR